MTAHGQRACGNDLLAWYGMMMRYAHRTTNASQPTPACRQVWRPQVLYLSQFLSTDVQKKGAQIASAQLLPLSMSKKSRQKMKTSSKKN